MTDNSNETKPPLFKTWTAWYFFVVIFLLAQIFFFYYLTKIYS